MKRNRVEQLIQAARKAHQPRPNEDVVAPFGFARRVAARWAVMKQTLRPMDRYERIAWCGAAVSSAICLLVMLERQSMAENNPFDPLLEMDGSIEQAF
jgi:hypothetical protein